MAGFGISIFETSGAVAADLVTCLVKMALKKLDSVDRKWIKLDEDRVQYLNLVLVMPDILNLLQRNWLVLCNFISKKMKL